MAVVDLHKITPLAAGNCASVGWVASDLALHHKVTLRATVQRKPRGRPAVAIIEGPVLTIESRVVWITRGTALACFLLLGFKVKVIGVEAIVQLGTRQRIGLQMHLSIFVYVNVVVPSPYLESFDLMPILRGPTQ
jgi:hypothetical protein